MYEQVLVSHVFRRSRSIFVKKNIVFSKIVISSVE